MAAFVLLPAAAIVFQNALQHVYWFVYFKEYAPGAVASVLLLIPTICCLAVRAVRQGYVSLWYVVGWAVLIIPGLVRTVKAGNRLTPQFRAIYSFSAALSKRLYRQ